MSKYEINELRNAISDYVYYSIRGGTCGDDSAIEIMKSAFRITRNWINRGESMQNTINHIYRLASSARLA